MIRLFIYLLSFTIYADNYTKVCLENLNLGLVDQYGNALCYQKPQIKISPEKKEIKIVKNAYLYFYNEHFWYHLKDCQLDSIGIPGHPKVILSKCQDDIQVEFDGGNTIKKEPPQLKILFKGKSLIGSRYNTKLLENISSQLINMRDYPYLRCFINYTFPDCRKTVGATCLKFKNDRQVSIQRWFYKTKNQVIHSMYGQYQIEDITTHKRERLQVFKHENVLSTRPKGNNRAEVPVYFHFRSQPFLYSEEAIHLHSSLFYDRDATTPTSANYPEQYREQWVKMCAQDASLDELKKKFPDIEVPEL